MGPPVEADLHFTFGDRNIGWRIDEISEDLTSLSIGVTTHSSCQQAIKAAGNHQQGHVKVYLQPDSRRESIHVKEPYCVRKRVLNEHALSITSNELLGRGVTPVGQEDGCILVAKILDKELTQVPSRQADRLLENARGAVFPGGYVQLDDPPGRTWQKNDLLYELR